MLKNQGGEAIVPLQKIVAFKNAYLFVKADNFCCPKILSIQADDFYCPFISCFL